MLIVITTHSLTSRKLKGKNRTKILEARYTFVSFKVTSEPQSSNHPSRVVEVMGMVMMTATPCLLFSYSQTLF